MKSEYIIFAGIVVVAAIFVYVKQSIDEKKGIDSEEKKVIKRIVADLVPNAELFTAAYAVREETSLGGGGRRITTTTSYWYYAVAFNYEDMYLIPLKFEGRTMKPNNPVRLSKEYFGMAEAGNHSLEMYDKEGEKVVSFRVLPSNTRDDKYHPVNIQQKEEAEAFDRIAAVYARDINAANGITDIKKAKKEFRNKK